ncbi:hypothetical protein HDV00_007508 [Rhizophlyctis rosea]|nr:hypothetical protein HDV00_007508 [Rhizophlyctis rosea]
MPKNATLSSQSQPLQQKLAGADFTFSYYHTLHRPKPTIITFPTPHNVTVIKNLLDQTTQAMLLNACTFDKKTVDLGVRALEYREKLPAGSTLMLMAERVVEDLKSLIVRADDVQKEKGKGPERFGHPVMRNGSGWKPGKFDI